MRTVNKRWVVASKKSDDIIEQVLLNRKVPKAQWHDFLNPDYERLSDPFKLHGMRKAVERILKAIADKQPIGLFGDFDADGIPSVALLHDALTHLGAAVVPYIPTRERGYGMSNDGIDYLYDQGCRLILTVDIGITAKAEVAHAVKKGIDVIVIDHHTVQAQKVPTAYAIVNPKQPADRSVFKDYAACGLAYKVVMALAQRTGKISKHQLKWWLDLPAISTVADMVPLQNENRIIAKFGLFVLAQTKRVGLRALYEKASIMPAAIAASTISFQIAPRINSAGRMEEPGLPIDYVSPAFTLLTTDDKQIAEALATELERVNRERQAVLDKVIASAKAEIEKNKLHERKIILITGRDWPAGVVGLVAGKLMEEYCRPTIVLRQEEAIVRGSARSIEAFNIMDALDHVKTHLLRHGGHPRAAGLSLELEHLETVYDKLQMLADSQLSDDDLVPRLNIDAALSLDAVTPAFYGRVKQLEPHGVGNPKPLFLFERLLVQECRAVGSDEKHLRLRLAQNGAGLGAIGFDLGRRNGEIKSGDLVDAVGYVDQDEWNGTKRLQLKIVDVKKSV